MPTAGSATYSGTYKGIAIADGYSPANHTGAANMTANFGAGTVNGSITNLSGSAYSISSPFLTGPSLPGSATIGFNGTITGTQFAGTTTFNSPSGTSTGSGKVVGGFFGVGAPEAAGVMSTKITTNSGQTATMLGTFGMKK
jgi:hypothetical protein